MQKSAVGERFVCEQADQNAQRIAALSSCEISWSTGTTIRSWGWSGTRRRTKSSEPFASSLASSTPTSTRSHLLKRDPRRSTRHTKCLATLRNGRRPGVQAAAQLGCRFRVLRRFERGEFYSVHSSKVSQLARPKGPLRPSHHIQRSASTSFIEAATTMAV